MYQEEKENHPLLMYHMMQENQWKLVNHKKRENHQNLMYQEEKGNHSFFNVSYHLTKIEAYNRITYCMKEIVIYS